MIVYVESNFVLELALGQEEASSAEAIITLAENGAIELVLPSFALSEPFATITQHTRERKRLSSSLTETLRQLQRSVPHEQVVSDLQYVPAILTDIAKRESALLQLTLQRLFTIGKFIEINGKGFEQALVYQSLLGLSPQDSIIYAAIIADLQNRSPKERKCFISRNWKDFRDFGIKYELESYSCFYMENFRTGLSSIQSSMTT